MTGTKEMAWVLKSYRLGFELWFCHLVAWPCESYLSSLSLIFLNGNVRLMLPALQDYCEEHRKRKNSPVILVHTEFSTNGNKYMETWYVRGAPDSGYLKKIFYLHLTYLSRKLTGYPKNRREPVCCDKWYPITIGLTLLFSSKKKYI